MNRIRSIFRHIRRLWDLVPITLAGIALGLGAWYVYARWGQGQSDFVLRAAAMVLLAVLATSVAFVILAGGALLWSTQRSIRRTRAEENPVGATAGHEIETGYRFSRFSFWPFVEVTMWWELPERVELRLTRRGRFYEEVVVPFERGRVKRIVRRFAIRDVLGLAKIAFSRTWPASIHVAPAPGDVRLAIALRDVSGEGYSHPAGKLEGELVEMRRYAPGDPLRLVLWKTFARTRRLLVRMPERAIAPQKSTVAFMVAGADDESSASTARTFVEEGLLGTEFVFSADGAHENVKTAPDAIEQLIDSIAHREQGGEGLPRLLAEIDRVQLGNCVLFLPARPGPWLEQVRTFAAGLPAPPTLVVGVDAPLELERRGRLARIVSFADGDAAPTLRELPDLYDDLRKISAQVRVVHRPSGRMVGEAEVEALRAL